MTVKPLDKYIMQRASDEKEEFTKLPKVFIWPCKQSLCD